jgi:hypothetical protein
VTFFDFGLGVDKNSTRIICDSFHSHHLHTRECVCYYLHMCWMNSTCRREGKCSFHQRLFCHQGALRRPLTLSCFRQKCDLFYGGCRPDKRFIFVADCFVAVFSPLYYIGKGMYRPLERAEQAYMKMNNVVNLMSQVN